ncbi:cardiolipin synthase [Halomonas halocynthiae]|uniref:cardiolipin synthase n=1 Tax=Halomonas halocynthiae TaxID=176290 RepID=UPI000426C50F|nr:cardiolipin synthase [Halomonas halocynthiae]
MASWLLGVIIPLIHILGMLSALHALMSSRTSQGAIAWIISLILMPYLAVPTYWVFGQPRFYGYVSARGHKDTVLRRALSEYQNSVDPYLASSNNPDILAVERLALMPLTRGNCCELLVEGEATFKSIFAGIDAAEDYVLMQFYIIRDDALGQRLQQHLIAAAERGVHTYLLYDELGSHRLPTHYLERLVQAGVMISAFHSSRFRRHRFQINFRNHRKITVIDGQSGWVGGFNVGVEYLGEDKHHGAWRDTHLKLTGPSVQGLQEAFWEDWHWATGDILSLNWTPRGSCAEDHRVVIVPSGPADHQETASLLVQHAIHSAQQRLWLTSPYFVPDRSVHDALRLAAMRGVDVRIILPERPDQLLVFLSAFSFLPSMIRAGIKIYRYQPGFMHQKVILIDDEAASVGTVNLDNRSFRLNFEITAFLPDKDFAATIERMLEKDLAVSRRVELSEITERSGLSKLLSRAAYLLAPIQ